MSLTTGRALRALVAAAVDVRAARADALLFELLHDTVVSEHRPVMLRNERVGVRTEAFERITEISGPSLRIPHLRTAQRQQVVQRVAKQGFDVTKLVKNR